MGMFKRGKIVIDIVTGGKKTKLANSYKDNNRLIFWYFVKLSCGGWREFDIRKLPWPDDKLIPRDQWNDWFEDCLEILIEIQNINIPYEQIVTARLERVAEIIEPIDLFAYFASEDMKNAREEVVSK